MGALYRRAFSLYSEYFPKFLKLSLIAHMPVIVTTHLLMGAVHLRTSICRAVGMPQQGRDDLGAW